MPKKKPEHSSGGVTTRDDATDLGVPMAAGPSHQGPEDALDPNARGDYSDRIGDASYQPHQVVTKADAEPGEPQVEVVDQRKARP